SPNHLAKQLDEIARRTVEDLFRATAEEAILSIAQRTAELSLHAKTIAAATAEARREASSIRLEAASNVLNASTEAIRAMAGLRQQLKSNASDKALAESIDNTVAVLQKLVADVLTVRE